MQTVNLVQCDLKLTIDSKELKNEDKVHPHPRTLIHQSLENIHKLTLHLLLQQHLLDKLHLTTHLVSLLRIHIVALHHPLDLCLHLSVTLFYAKCTEYYSNSSIELSFISRKLFSTKPPRFSFNFFIISSYFLSILPKIGEFGTFYVCL